MQIGWHNNCSYEDLAKFLHPRYLGLSLWNSGALWIWLPWKLSALFQSCLFFLQRWSRLLIVSWVHPGLRLCSWTFSVLRAPALSPSVQASQSCQSSQVVRWRDQEGKGTWRSFEWCVPTYPGVLIAWDLNQGCYAFNTVVFLFLFYKWTQETSLMEKYVLMFKIIQQKIILCRVK